MVGLPRLRLSRLRFGVAMSLVIGVSAAATASASADNIYYCGYTIPQGQCTFEPNGSAVSNQVNVNHSYIPGGGYPSVCERAYQYFSGVTVSRRCAPGYASSDVNYCAGDLWPWYGTELLLTAANNQSLYVAIDGHTYVESVCT
jgi:hypothetical protein